ncbi:tryptophan synthase subunit alpha [Halosimplex sp. J119]
MGLERVFADGPAFIPYVAAGDPSYEESLEYVEALERGGADVIELGLPFSEPMAEGRTIQEAVVRSLEAGMTPEHYFEFVEDLDVDVPLVCMTYYNLVAQYTHPETGERGPRAFARRAAEVGIEGFVVVDLPAEEAGPLREACDEFDQDLVFIIAPTTRGERLERMRENVSGYVYVQARLGVTGAREDVSGQTEESLARVADWEVPKAVGFGIKTGEHAERIVSAGADGIIVGSALVDIIAAGADPEVDQPFAETAQRLESKARELKEGALAGAEARTASEQSD